MKPGEHSCCHTDVEGEQQSKKRSVDWLLWFGGSTVLLGSLLAVFLSNSMDATWWLAVFSASIWALLSKMWIGLVLAVIFVGLLSYIPRDLVTQMLGPGGSFKGILRATMAGVLLDLCSHGILMVGAKLYERGASIGQVMAFLIASPWNSLSLTIVMLTLIGIKWTAAFILLSVLIALLSGLIFDQLTRKNILPKNPAESEIPSSPEPIAPQLRTLIKSTSFAPKSLGALIYKGLKESRMVFRWIFFGIVLASAIRTFVPMDTYQQLFGPTVTGLFLTLVAAIIVEVCSEGSTPIAADLLTRAGAPGNSFTFLMAGVSTDYTEVMVLKDTTKSWKIALFLPLITLPQVLVLGWVLNQI
jgi:uncharacterized protein